jgi:hypothetical protein
MTIDKIKAAVDIGLNVKWVNDGYDVIRDSLGEYLIIYRPNGYCIGLTNRAGDVLNGKPEDFYVSRNPVVR